MINRFFVLFALVLVSGLNAQDLEPVEWDIEKLRLSDTKYLLKFNATIESGWHLYSLYSDENDLASTEFIFLNQDNRYRVLHPIRESKPIVDYDPIFQTELSFFEEDAFFEVEIELFDSLIQQIAEFEDQEKSDSSDLEIEVEVLYQACDDMVCIFRDRVFSFPLIEIAYENQSDEGVNQDPILLDENSKLKTSQLYLDLRNKEFLSQQHQFQQDYWTIFLLGLIGGLLALLTPCVLPMVPLTVSYFIKQSSSRKSAIVNGILYGSFILLVYLLLSLPFHLLDTLNPEILNTLATNVTLNIVFFGIFILFALSFFGLFDIRFPSNWVQRTEKLSSIGSVAGIFFMALTLAIVSFSCTGPLLGSLLAGSFTSNSGAIQLTFGMLGFGVALGLPFALFAMFPGTLNWIPKSGRWLQIIKVTLGFVELALALKFLSNADLVAGWGLIKREVFIAIWLLISLALCLYLFGFFESLKIWSGKISWGRFGLGIMSLIFCAYLFIGLVSDQNRLKLLSGFPPPDFYTIVDSDSSCPLDLPCYKDFEEGLTVARSSGKPILLDFTGWACINCRKMEENVWSYPPIYELLNRFVIISLYVDDRKKLGGDDRFYFKYPDGRIRDINTIGKKWSTFQSVNFKVASQPFYIQMTADQELLNSPIQYSSRIAFEAWLREGLQKEAIN